jgi:hypothetical protein
MWEWRYSSTILDFGTRWRWMISFTPRPLITGERAAGTNWIWGWMGPQSRSIRCEEETNFCPYRQSNSGRPARTTSLYRLRYPGFLFLYVAILNVEQYVMVKCSVNSLKVIRIKGQSDSVLSASVWKHPLSCATCLITGRDVQGCAPVRF